jgi:hypothetical protein
MRINPASFLPHLKGLRFDHIEVSGCRIVLTVTAIRPTAACPLLSSVGRRCTTPRRP